ncbi:SPOSA6832_01605 [Sporobolomyces salmonicolor]|uniref:Mitochondrial import inner membrane translocase subunit n=1 Tax=Sporidiobolus salmonicolor TaxID=5005 RepID=A0A0D6EJD0_SPOSA|nr:SPOSA6832_01605 [Sporobolomyces salmonicolor]
MDASGMNPATAAAFEGMMQQKQMKDFMQLYQNLVERCFTSCCNDFTSKALSSKEVRRRLPCIPILSPLVPARRAVEARIEDPGRSASRRRLSTAQEYCVNTCADKFLKHSERVGLRMAKAQQQRQ